MKRVEVWLAVLLLATVAPDHTTIWLRLFVIVPLVYTALGHWKAKP